MEIMRTITLNDYFSILGYYAIITLGNHLQQNSKVWSHDDNSNYEDMDEYSLYLDLQDLQYFCLKKIQSISIHYF